MTAALFVQSRSNGGNIFLHARNPLNFQQALQLSHAFAVAINKTKVSKPKDMIPLMNCFNAYYNVVNEVFIVGVCDLESHATQTLEAVRSVKNLLVQACGGPPKVTVADLQKKFTELFLCIDEIVHQGNFPLESEVKDQMMARRLTSLDSFNPYGEGHKCPNIAFSNSEIRNSITRHSLISDFEFSFSDDAPDSSDRGLFTSSFLPAFDPHPPDLVNLRSRNERPSGGGDSPVGHGLALQGNHLQVSPMSTSPVSDSSPTRSPLAVPSGRESPSPIPNASDENAHHLAPPDVLTTKPSADAEVIPAISGEINGNSMPLNQDGPNDVTPPPLTQELLGVREANSKPKHQKSYSFGSCPDLSPHSPVPPFPQSPSSPFERSFSPNVPSAPTSPSDTKSQKVVLPFKAMAQETITASYSAASSSLTNYSLLGDFLVNVGKPVVPVSKASEYPDHTICSFLMKIANAAGRVDQCKVNPAYAQDLGGFKFRCDFAIVNEEADLPAAPVTMVKYKTIPGFCPVPLRVKQEWTTVAEPSLQENSGEDEAPAYIGTDQLHLQWLINPATPLTSLSFLINPTTAIAHAINQKSKPPGVWNADQGKLMWTVIAPDHETLPDQLMARFQMKSSAPTGDSEVHRAQPVSARLEGKRNRPITDLQFSFAVISPDSDQPTPAEVKGGVIGKFISNAYTFC